MDEVTLQTIERDHAQGLTSQEILALFKEQGIAMSEASLRKYVQLGLLPRSVRVGEKGKHRGSRGVYPVRVVRQILVIKQLMAQQYTIEQLQKEFFFLRGELDELEENLKGIFKKLGTVVRNRQGATIPILARDVKEAETVGRDLLGRLRRLEDRFSPSSDIRQQAAG